MKKVTLDPTRIEYDGHGFKAVFSDKQELRKRLERLRDGFLKDKKLKVLND